MWLVQAAGVDALNGDKVMKILKRKGIPFAPVGTIPFSTEITGLDGVDLNEPTMIYGSTKLVRLAMEMGLKPGVFFDFSSFNAFAWKTFLGRFMLNSANFYQIHELRRDVYNFPDRDVPVFVRPVMDLKTFPGTVKSGKNYHEFFDDKLNGVKSLENTVVAVSSPIKIRAEWRCFLVNRKLVTGTQYRNRGELVPFPGLPDGIEDFVEEVAAAWLPHDHCVMDIADTDRGLKVVEFNCIHCSGLYEADVGKLVDALQSLL